MYNLLLVDDERLTLEGLYGNVDWQGLGFAEVFKELTAAGALQRVQQTRVDVIVTDIILGEMNGLELCKHILELWPYAKIVILSGYRDFEYAQRAIELNAFRYLLKPFLYEELASIVGEALAAFQQDMEKREILEMARRQLSNMPVQLTEQYLTDWVIRGITSPEKDKELAEQCGVYIAEDAWCVPLAVFLDHPPQSSVNAMHIRLTLGDMAVKMLSNGMAAYQGAESDRLLLLLFLAKTAQDADKQYKRLSAQLETYLMAVEQTLSCTVSLYVGNPCQSDEVTHEWQRIKTMLWQERDLRTGVIACPEAERTFLSALEMHPPLTELLSQEDWQAVYARIRLLFAQLQQYGSKSDSIRVYLVVLEALLTDSTQNGLALPEWIGCVNNLMHGAADMLPPEMCDQCLKMYENYRIFIQQRRKNNRIELVKKVEQYIVDHIQEDFSCVELAEYFHYHANYLSRILKNSIGKSLSEMVIDVRIRRACQLLDEGVRVSDAAVMTGYDNFSYFSRLFKNLMGMTPRQYRHRNEENTEEKL